MSDPSSRPLTIPALLRLARRYCPVKARWSGLVQQHSPEWGPGHEIGHALLSRPRERSLKHYGLCSLGSCLCLHERCHVVELAAMYISSNFHHAADRHDLVAMEIQATDGYTTINTPWYWMRAAKLLAGQHLTRLPRTVLKLEELLTRRLLRK